MQDFVLAFRVGFQWVSGLQLPKRDLGVRHWRGGGHFSTCCDLPKEASANQRYLPTVFQYQGM